MKAINFTPQTDCVVIERLPPEKVTASGIIIPDQATRKMNEGLVLAVGAGIRNERTGIRMPMTVKAGDRVLFNNFEVQDFCYEDRNYLIVHETDLCAVVDA